MLLDVYKKANPNRLSRYNHPPLIPRSLKNVLYFVHSLCVVLRDQQGRICNSHMRNIFFVCLKVMMKIMFSKRLFDLGLDFWETFLRGYMKY